jgi:hypothetical protein
VTADSLASRNRRALAERLRWPDGALEECERLARDHPRWWVVWDRGCTTPGWERPAGYRACLVDLSIRRWPKPGVELRAWWLAATLAELAALMAEVQESVVVEEERCAQPLGLLGGS